MSSLKCVRSLIPVDTFSACHPSKRLCPGVRQLSGMDGATIGKSAAAKAAVLNHIKGFSHTLYTVDATKFDMAQIDATFHEGRGKWSADNQVVGIGSGTTIISAVKTLAERVSKENLKLVCIPTSFQARQLILEHKLTLGSLEQYPELDVAIDGADEIDKDLVCIKGGGGCLTQEKIVAYNAKEFIVCVEESKNVPELGTYWKKGIPLEVMPLAYRPLQLTIESKFGGHADLRMASRKMGPVVSDNGNFILDWRFDKVGDWSKINNQLIHIPGIVETGIFTGMVTKAYIGSADGTVIVKDRNSNSPGTVVETGLFIGMVSKAYIGRGDGTVIVKDRNCNDASSGDAGKINPPL